MDNKHFTVNDVGQYVATYHIAGFDIEIRSLFKAVHIMCREYVTEARPEMSISITSKELNDAKYSFAKDGDDITESEPNYIEILLVYRKMALMLLDHDVLLMHGSCIAVDGEGVLFTAHSGTGKSTHTRLWREMLGDRAVMVNDDKPLVAVSRDSAPIIYGTPWDGKHHLSTNIGVPLKAIVYLERGEENEIQEISTSRMLPVLLEQTFCMPDALVTMKVLDLLGNMVRNVKFYDLHCNMNPEAAEKAYSTIFYS